MNRLDMIIAQGNAIRQLRQLSDLDFEAAHIEADDIILTFLDTVAPEVAEAYRDAKRRVGFLY